MGCTSSSAKGSKKAAKAVEPSQRAKKMMPGTALGFEEGLPAATAPLVVPSLSPRSVPPRPLPQEEEDDQVLAGVELESCDWSVSSEEESDGAGSRLREVTDEGSAASAAGLTVEQATAAPVGARACLHTHSLGRPPLPPTRRSRPPSEDDAELEAFIALEQGMESEAEEEPRSFHFQGPVDIDAIEDPELGAFIALEQELEAEAELHTFQGGLAARGYDPIDFIEDDDDPEVAMWKSVEAAPLPAAGCEDEGTWLLAPSAASAGDGFEKLERMLEDETYLV